MWEFSFSAFFPCSPAYLYHSFTSLPSGTLSSPFFFPNLFLSTLTYRKKEERGIKERTKKKKGRKETLFLVSLLILPVDVYRVLFCAIYYYSYYYYFIQEKRMERQKNVALASSTASIFTKTILHPLDTIKCRFQLLALHSPPASRRSMTSGVQVQQNSRSTAIAAASTTSCRPTGSTWHRVRHQFQGHWRIRDFYGGLPPKLVCYVPYQSLYMVTYDSTIQFLQSPTRYGWLPSYSKAGHPSSSTTTSFSGTTGTSHESGWSTSRWHTMAAAMAAELIGCFIRIPMEATKIWVQSTVSPHSLAALTHFGTCDRTLSTSSSPFVSSSSSSATPSKFTTSSSSVMEPNTKGVPTTSTGFSSSSTCGLGGNERRKGRWPWTTGGSTSRFRSSSSSSSSLSLWLVYTRMRRLCIPQTLLHDIPYSVCQWLAYEGLRPWVAAKKHPPCAASHDIHTRERTAAGETKVQHPLPGPSTTRRAQNVMPTTTGELNSEEEHISGRHCDAVPFARTGKEVETTAAPLSASPSSISSSSSSSSDGGGTSANLLTTPHNEKEPLTSPWFFARTAVAGGAAGLIASVLTIPLDHIRTRALVLEGHRSPLQRHETEMGKTGSGTASWMSTNNGKTMRKTQLLFCTSSRNSAIWDDIIRPVYLERGITGFFRGGGWRVMWVTSNMALYFPIFELLKRQL